jgi:NAD(P)H-dependent FMN reductase
VTIKLKIIVASTRPGRIGPAVADWVQNFAVEQGTFDVELVDLADMALPLLDEGAHPMAQQYVHEHTKKWSTVVSEADAYVFVTPEYDYFPPASVVNAIQYLLREWFEKPAGIVSYGGVSGGLRSTQALRQLLGNVNVMALPTSVPIPFVSQFLADNTFTPNEQMLQGASVMFNQLHRWAVGLKNMRASPS